MSHRITVIIVLMALLVAFVSVPIVVADGPNTSTLGTPAIDGGDGHPWDDDTGGQDTTPPDDQEQPMECEIQPGPGDLGLYATSVGANSPWLSSVLYHLWKSIEDEVKQMRRADKPYKAERVR